MNYRRGVSLFELMVYLLLLVFVAPIVVWGGRFVVQTPASRIATTTSQQLNSLSDLARSSLQAGEWRMIQDQLEIGDMMWAADERGFVLDKALALKGGRLSYRIDDDGWLVLTIQADNESQRILHGLPSQGDPR